MMRPRRPDGFLPPKPKGMHRSTHAREIEKRERYEILCEQSLDGFLARFRR